MLYKSIKANYALSKTALPGLDYSINPYFGCEHGCIYCYARKFFLIKEIKHEWGEYIEVKENLPTLLTKQLRRVPKNSVIGIGTSTDPYQPLEKKYRITRKVLSVLKFRKDIEVEIQTKSALVLRDLNLLKEINKISIGFTILTIDDELRRFLEPRASKISERFKALKRLKEAGIETWVFIGPILPWITDNRENLEKLVAYSHKIGVSKIYADRLRFRLGVRPNMVRKLIDKFPTLSDKYSRLTEKELMKKYTESIEILSKACREYGLEFEDVSYFK